MAAVVAVPVKEGDLVARGQLLVEIDPQTAKGQEAQARASIQVQGNAIVSPAVPAMPALGAVHDPLAGYGRYERPHAFPYWQGGWGGYPGYGWGWGASFYTPGWGISVSPVPFCPTPRIFRSTITR